jgi:hypothetical protein
MNRKTKSAVAASDPRLWQWLREFGTIEIGHCHQTRSFIRVLDEGGLVWKGRRGHASLDAALAHAEAGVARWMRECLGITDAALPGSL